MMSNNILVQIIKETITKRSEAGNRQERKFSKDNKNWVK